MAPASLAWEALSGHAARLVRAASVGLEALAVNRSAPMPARPKGARAVVRRGSTSSLIKPRSSATSARAWLTLCECVRVLFG
uniref:Putative secreted protein n=1 Tax=Ixodes ricinus TaxID=34613 RepID=A0A6B0U7H6_IXORI